MYLFLYCVSNLNLKNFLLHVLLQIKQTYLIKKYINKYLLILINIYSCNGLDYFVILINISYIQLNAAFNIYIYNKRKK